jgi:hypothetical protein
MGKAFQGLIHASDEVKRIMYHVIHAGREWVHGMGNSTRPYNGTTDPHYGHIHLGAWPPYAKGGYVDGKGGGGRDNIPARLSKGEFILNAAAVRAIGAQNLMALNARPSSVISSMLGGPSVPTGALPFSRPDVATIASASMQGARSDGREVEASRPINLTLMVDGKMLTKTVEVHGREAQLLLGGSR